MDRGQPCKVGKKDKFVRRTPKVNCNMPTFLCGGGDRGRESGKGREEERKMEIETVRGDRGGRGREGEEERGRGR